MSQQKQSYTCTMSRVRKINRNFDVSNGISKVGLRTEIYDRYLNITNLNLETTSVEGVNSRLIK